MKLGSVDGGAACRDSIWDVILASQSATLAALVLEGRGGMLGAGAIRLLAKLWYVKMLSDQQSIPVPRDGQEILSGAVDPDRVLLIGNGPTHGWGTVSHQLALTGQLGRTFTRRTGRATDVHYVGAEMMNLASVQAWIGDQRLDGFDLILVVLSMNDALRLTPLQEFRRGMSTLLDRLTAGADPPARVVVAGIHSIASSPHYQGVLARVMQRRADELNAITRGEVEEHEQAIYMHLDAPTPEPARPHGSPGMYAEWSEIFATVCVPELECARLARSTPRPAVAPRAKWDWEPAGRVLERSVTDGAALSALVAEAKDDFGVDIAYVTLVDGTRQYYLANTGPGSREVPLELSHCRETIRGDDALVVPNSLKDPRFKDSPLLDLTQLRFYAGVPLKDTAGENIGTFCVASVLPRSRRSARDTMLRDYAHRAEQELRRLAAADDIALISASP